MAPLIVLLFSFAFVSATFRMLRGNWAVGRSGLAAAASMFIFTGVSHFIFPEAMTEMVPPIFPAPRVWVAGTGVAEIAGGVGLLFT